MRGEGGARISPQRDMFRKQLKAPLRAFFGYDEKDEILRFKKSGEPFLYIDHAYFDRGYERENFRIIYNTIHQTNEYDLPDDRRKKFGVVIKDWTDGEKILFIPAPPNPLWFHKDPKWNETAIDGIVKHTNREVVVKNNKTKGLGNAIYNCFAIVSHSSVAAVEAAISGIPVICPETCPAYPIGAPLEQINNPVRPDRNKWVNTLTYSQFSADEMRSGFAWATIKEMNGL